MTQAFTRDEMLHFVSARGVQPSFFDAFDVERQIPDSTLAWLYEEFQKQADVTAPLIASPGKWHPELHGEIELGDGRRMHVEGILPIDAEGYHRLRTPHGQTRLVLCAPDRLATPQRCFGWSVQLYDARTANSWGIGDFADLAALGRIAARSGAGFMLTCPLHAGNLGVQPMASPYSPSSREWLQVLYISIDLIRTTVDVSDLREQARALNQNRIIDRGAVWALKRAALRRIWEGQGNQGGPDCDAWMEEHGENLRSFATFTALTEELGLPWQTWPSEYLHPDSPAVRDWARQHADAVAFHAWLQFLCDRQLGRASRQGVDIVADIAVGFDGGGFDAWHWQDILVFDAEVGAPPDRHNRDGQRWGLPAFSPTGLISVGFDPFIRMVRSALRHAKGLRIDHVMQLWRLFWVPPTGGAAEGAYVRYPHDALLAIIRIEADRTHAWVVGEDMGTVPEYVRPTMNDIDMLGYRAACRVPVSMFTVNTFGATGTHDHATIAGILCGTDPLDMQSAGKTVDWEGERVRQQDLAREAGLPEDGPYTDAQVRQAIRARCQTVAESASRVVVFNLEDAAEVRHRPNMPGTTSTWPNWCLALPRPADEVLGGELAQAIAANANRTRRLAR
ncbi:MAG: 4-alpha-glucanotransferase [Candidatus Nanopelagicales bacterium]